MFCQKLTQMVQREPQNFCLIVRSLDKVSFRFQEKSDVVEKNMHSHENERNPSSQNARRDKMFTHNLFNLANIDISGAVAGDAVSIGSLVEIKDHVDSPEHEYGELLTSLFKQIDLNDDGLKNAKELLKICQENKIYITEMDAERILTARNKLGQGPRSHLHYHVKTEKNHIFHTFLRISLNQQKLSFHLT